MKIYCCACSQKVEARLTDGAEIYPHRTDLHSLPFWKCDTCGNYTGTHHKRTENPLEPLGTIPSPEIRDMRISIHAILDPLWRSGKIKRRTLYNRMSKKMGLRFEKVEEKRYHTGNLITIEEAQKAYEAALLIHESVTGEKWKRHWGMGSLN